MSRGVPIAQRPDLKDASLSARLDAVFGALGGPADAGTGGWTLRQDVQPFRAGGGIEDYKYSSDEEDPNEGLKPLMPSRLVDSDDEGGDDAPALERADPDADADEEDGSGVRAEERAARERERLRCTLSSRRAFEAEAEEDEFDRFATGTMDMRNRLTDSRPPGSTEVPLDSAWERMHSRWEQSQRGPNGEAAEPMQQDEPQPGTRGMEPSEAAAPATTGAAAVTRFGTTNDASGGLTAEPAGAAATAETPSSRKRSRRDGSAAGGGSGAAVGDVEMAAAIGEGGGADSDAPGDAEPQDRAARGGVVAAVSPAAGPATDGAGDGDATAAATAGGVAAQPSRQRGGRRVQWADFVAASGRPAEAAGTDPRDTSTALNGCAPAAGGRRGDAGRPAGRGGRVRLDWQRRGFVPDHVRNPQKYTMYTLDEELVVGGGERSANGRNGGTAQGANGAGTAWHEPGGARGGEEDEMRQALVQAQSVVAAAAAAQHDPERAETTFGSGITFRSRAQRRGPTAAAPVSGPAAEAGGNGDEEPEPGAGLGGVRPRGARPGVGVGPGQARRVMFEEGDADGDADAGVDAGAGGGTEGRGGAGGRQGSGNDAAGPETGMRAGGRRHFRSRRAAAAEDEEAAGAGAGVEDDGRSGGAGAAAAGTAGGGRTGPVDLDAGAGQKGGEEDAMQQD